MSISLPLNPQCCQSLGSVLGRHVHQLLVLAPIRYPQGDGAPSFLLQPSLNDQRLVNLLRQQDLGGNIGRLLVELLEKGSHHLAITLLAGPFQHEVLTPEELPPSNEEDLYTGIVLFASEGYHILVDTGYRDDLLLPYDAVHGLELISKGGCLFVVPIISSLAHPRLEIGDHLLAVSFEEADKVIYHSPVSRPRHRTDTRPQTAVDLVIETRTLILARDVTIAR